MYKTLLMLFFSMSVFASVDATIATNVASNINTKVSQSKIDSLSEQQKALFSEYRNELREIETLKLYNAQLQNVVDAQKEEIKTFDEQIIEIEITQQRIMPLMSQMIQTLRSFVAQDIPFLHELRETKRQQLDTLLAKSNLTISQKYRYIIEAYAIEMDYGRTIETYEGKLDNALSVNFLRIGRTGLYYLTHNEESAGIYNPNTSKFEPLDKKYNKSIKTGIKIARKQLAPQLLKLPVVATKEQ